MDFLNKKNINASIEYLFDIGIDEVAIVNEMIRKTYELLLFTLSAKVNGKVDSKDILGYKLPKQIEEKRGMLAVRLNLTQYQQILTALQECEFKIKIDSKIDKKSIFLSTLIKIQTKLL